MLETQGNTQTPQPQTPAIPASPATGVVQQNAIATLNPEALAKLQEKANSKYGGDLNKAIEGLENAESKMHEATTERKQFELRVQELTAELEQAKKHPANNLGGSQGQPSDIERQRIETEYGRPYEEVVANFKIAEMAQLPTLEALSSIQIKDKIQELKSKDILFTDSVASKFESLLRSKHPRDRMIPQIVNECLSIAKGGNLSQQSINEIVEAQVQERLKAFTNGNPVNPPSANPPTNANVTLGKKLTIDDAHVARIAQASGKTVEEVKAMYSE